MLAGITLVSIVLRLICQPCYQPYYHVTSHVAMLPDILSVSRVTRHIPSHITHKDSFEKVYSDGSILMTFHFEKVIKKNQNFPLKS